MLPLQVLAEAEKELTVRMPKTVEKDIVIFVPQEWDVALTPINPAPKKAKNRKTGDLDPLPKWVEALEPVRKMPTNLGTKLKLQVQEALDYDPPDWAKGTLEWSLSKGTFKSNAAGTTKVHTIFFYSMSLEFRSCNQLRQTEMRVPHGTFIFVSHFCLPFSSLPHIISLVLKSHFVISCISIITYLSKCLTKRRPV